MKYRVVPTLADIGQLVWDDLNVFDEYDDDDDELDDAGDDEDEEAEEEYDDEDTENEKYEQCRRIDENKAIENGGIKELKVSSQVFTFYGKELLRVVMFKSFARFIYLSFVLITS